MGDNFQLRHFDYVLQVPSLPAGDQVRLPLNLDTDSSFILRGRAIHTQTATPNLAGQTVALTNYFDRFTGPDNDDLADGLTRFSQESRILGQYGLALPVRPPMIYPPGGTIYVDILNGGGDDYTNLEVYFRGQKIFAPGVLPCYTYPERFYARPAWAGAQGWTSPGSTSVTLTPSGQGSVVRDNRFQASSFADFVARTLSIGSFDPATFPDGTGIYREVHIQLKDMDGRTYSNVPVHVDVCFGAYGSLAVGDSSGVPYGNWLPPLLTPEIYIPANQFLLYDLYRADGFVGGLAPVDLQLCFGGAQIFRK